MNQKQKTEKKSSQGVDDELLKLEAEYCSWGDTVHYSEKLNVFERSEGIYLYDRQGIEYLDLQMWYSAANFGYKNGRLNDALKRQIDKLPQLACQYLHEEKIRLAAKLSRRIGMIFEEKGRVHFNVGGSAAIEDSLKIVRSHTARNLVFAFMGGYH
ncbi:MAG: aminotransferase class III-fold pyridoxal phosphate-dependent enzyme, partial [Candidatus Omnitrophica bacterium]|nr:aminotransferase class III-fold pyridoxal phosphate-dependent enzyme [Candidatus Omnitrophota bacterium]